MRSEARGGRVDGRKEREVVEMKEEGMRGGERKWRGRERGRWGENVGEIL